MKLNCPCPTHKNIQQEKRFQSQPWKITYPFTKKDWNHPWQYTYEVTSLLFYAHQSLEQLFTSWTCHWIVISWSSQKHNHGSSNTGISNPHQARKILRSGLLHFSSFSYNRVMFMELEYNHNQQLLWLNGTMKLRCLIITCKPHLLFYIVLCYQLSHN